MGVARNVAFAAVVLIFIRQPDLLRSLWKLLRSKYINRMSGKYLSDAGVALGNISTMIENKDRLHFWYLDVTNKLGHSWVSVNPFWDFDCILINSPENVQVLRRGLL
jgi:hypothetical protein